MREELEPYTCRSDLLGGTARGLSHAYAQALTLDTLPKEICFIVPGEQLASAYTHTRLPAMPQQEPVILSAL